MVSETLISTLEAEFALCRVQESEICVVLSDEGTRPCLISASVEALRRLKANVFRLELVGVGGEQHGAQVGEGRLLKLPPALSALQHASFIVDLTTALGGLIHDPAREPILEKGARILHIAENPEILSRLLPDPELKARVEAAVAQLRQASIMRVTSEAGTDLTVHLSGAVVNGLCGYVDTPGRLDVFPAGFVAAYPAAHSVNGTLVLSPGDIDLTFMRFVDGPVELIIQDDYITEIRGDSVHARLLREYMARWGERDAYATSHVGWGLNSKARWENFAFFPFGETEGMEARSFAGNFLFSSGANRFAGRYSHCHFDLPMRGCSVYLDDTPVVLNGALASERPS
jgi:2,5-dihydroxypyridine 5,6-dioxygenase